MVLSPLRRWLPPILVNPFAGAGKKRKLEDLEPTDNGDQMDIDVANQVRPPVTDTRQVTNTVGHMPLMNQISGWHIPL